MSDKLVDIIREEDYTLKVFTLTRDSKSVQHTTQIVKFVQNIYRFIEPSHYEGELYVFIKNDDTLLFDNEEGIDYWDSNILNHNFTNMVFQIFQDEQLPKIYTNIPTQNIQELIDSDNYITYVYKNKKEYFYVNKNEIKITNKFSCSSIYALQYHFLNEALLSYKNERIRKVSCELFKNSWADEKYIYFISSPENSIQNALSEYLKNSIRGVDVVREYNLGASKPVDIRVYWREANRAAIIEVKLMGRCLDMSGNLNSTNYTNSRANDGMKQIKEYMDLVNSDSPTVINKGYLTVIDGRRRNIDPKISSIDISNGFHYANTELNIDAEYQYHKTYLNIESPIRMFAEPICN
ncbi:MULTISPECIES: hypothetical protein [Flavobacterium]|uniref:hypothetical protein n=1 Tax=Flavobacterium TaxID=237 RepID=UPI002115C367|nr:MULTISPECIES: hypothetical protein [Flavobacterium]UUF13542.1 hypothetical protein NLJ00_20005 [Flavobacterium panici]